MIWQALVSRGLLPVILWSGFSALLVWFWGDSSYVLTASVGVPPRRLVMAEVIGVASGCCVPALAYPQLWSWESPAARIGPRIVSALFAPSAVWLVAVTPLAVQRYTSRMSAEVAFAILANTVAFGSLALIASIVLGRRGGPILGSGSYLALTLAQALAVPAPLPIRPAEAATDSILAGTAAMLIAAALMALTLGRLGRHLQVVDPPPT